MDPGFGRMRADSVGPQARFQSQIPSAAWAARNVAHADEQDALWLHSVVRGSSNDADAGVEEQSSCNAGDAHQGAFGIREVTDDKAVGDVAGPITRIRTSCATGEGVSNSHPNRSP
jgi:hypothetical protein